MALKLENGAYALQANGLPQEIDRLEELLQNAWLRLTLPKGSFPYEREAGSGLAGADLSQEHGEERALALANEALLDLPGVRAEQARPRQEGGIVFTLSTPLGKGEVVYGEL